MNEAAQILLNHFQFQATSSDSFTNVNSNEGGQQIFGGQLMAQAICVACKTVVDGKKPVSFQSTFLAPGKVTGKTTFSVSRLRDGNSTTIRRVDAVQEQQTFFTSTVVFHKTGTSIDAQKKMPKVAHPDNCFDLDAMVVGYKERFPTHLPDMGPESLVPLEAIETRFPVIQDSFGPANDVTEHIIWMKFSAPLGDDLSLHKQILTYASDQGTSHIVSQPFALGGMNPRFNILSLDHSVWFHRDFRADEWFLMVRRCESATSNRAIVVGEMFDLQGDLIAVMTQQALYRYTADATGA